MALPGFDQYQGLTGEAIDAIPNLIRILEQRDRENPIHGAELAERINNIKGTRLTDVHIRGMVAYIRGSEKPEPVASGASGYFWARLPEDLNETIEHLDARITALMRARGGVQKARQGLETHQRGLF